MPEIADRKVTWPGQQVLPLGGLIWAATGKDPGLNPSMLLELLQRKRTVDPDEFRRLYLRQPIPIREIRETWEAALTAAAGWIPTRPADESGCLYTDPDSGLVVAPYEGQTVNLLWGKPYGVLPQIREMPMSSFSDSKEMQLFLESFFQKRVKE